MSQPAIVDTHCHLDYVARREDLPLLEYYANSVAHLLAEPVPAMAGAPTAPPARL